MVSPNIPDVAEEEMETRLLKLVEALEEYDREVRVYAFGHKPGLTVELRAELERAQRFIRPRRWR